MPSASRRASLFSTIACFSSWITVSWSVSTSIARLRECDGRGRNTDHRFDSWNVIRFPNGSTTVMTRAPQGASSTCGR